MSFNYTSKFKNLILSNLLNIQSIQFWLFKLDIFVNLGKNKNFLSLAEYSHFIINATA